MFGCSYITSIRSWWNEVARRNGALQLVFGLLFGVGSGKWRIACGLLVIIQALGYFGAVQSHLSEQDKHLRMYQGNFTTTIAVIDLSSSTAYHFGLLATYVFAFYYVRKYDFVANIGMRFPCPPSTDSCRYDNDEQGLSALDEESFSINGDRAAASYNTTADQGTEVGPCFGGKQEHGSLSGRTFRNITNISSVLLLVVMPCFWLAVYFSKTISFPGSPVSIIVQDLQLSFGVFGDLAMCLAFTSMTQDVVDEIKVAQRHLLSPAHFRRRFSQRSDRVDIVRQAVAQIERLKQEIASWLGTMSLWFTIHMATLLLTIIGNVILTIESAPLHNDWWGFDFLYLTIILSFSVPFLSASRVARHWDRMTDAVMTSEKWLPEHWQEHMYLRQFLELSPGGYYLLGFRISGSIVFSSAVVFVSFLGASLRGFL